MKRKRKKSNTNKEASFFKEYNFEITVFGMFLLGVFLLVEKWKLARHYLKLSRQRFSYLQIL